jgi:hypothetical protein
MTIEIRFERAIRSACFPNSCGPHADGKVRLQAMTPQRHLRDMPARAECYFSFEQHDPSGDNPRGHSAEDTDGGHGSKRAGNPSAR